MTHVVLVARDPVLSECVKADLAGTSFNLEWVPPTDRLDENLKALTPKVVILPAEFPDYDTIALATRLRRSADAGRPSVVILGLDEDHRAAARKAPGVAYLEIPFGRTELLETLARVLRKTKLVVLADDSPLVHLHTRPILEEAGYETLSASDGAEALRLVRSRRPDLVITDIEMPEMDGYQVCRAIKEDPELGSIPVVICSALGEAADLEKGFTAGADDYLVKPALPEELLSRIRTLFASIDMVGRERILVVEDSPPVRHLVADALSRQGFDVATAQDGLAGFERAKQILPDLVITDYDMPGWTGFQLVHALKRNQETRDIPVMMLTARESRRDQAQMRAVGLAAYLVKPFSADKCIAVVERLLAERRLIDYKRASRLYLSEGTAAAAEAQAASGTVGAVRAEELVMTVLFADICGFTPLSHEKTPAEVVALLNRYFDLVCPIILEEGGDIDKFVGDAVLALFSDQPERSGALAAVRCALRIQKTLKDHAQSAKTAFTCRIGINTGPLIRGDYGSQHFRRDYSVIGDTVNLAQRFESQATPGGVLVSSETYEACAGLVVAKRIEGIRLKGIDEAVAAFRVTGLAPPERAADRSAKPNEPGGEL